MKTAFKNAAGIARKITVAIRDARLFTCGASRIGAVVFAAVMCLGLAACGGGGGGSSSAAPPATPVPTPTPQGDVRVQYNLPGVANGLTQSVPRSIVDSPTQASYRFPLTIDGVAYTVELTMQNGQIVSADARRLVAVSPPVNPDPPGNSGGIPNALIPTAGAGVPDPFFMADCTSDCYSGNLDDNERIYENGLVIAGMRWQAAADDLRVEMPNPPQDVRDAWRAGWTGQGVNMLFFEKFAPWVIPGNGTILPGHGHGPFVVMAAKEIAPRADIFFLERGEVISINGNIVDVSYGATHDANGREIFPATSRPTAETRIDAIVLGDGLPDLPISWPDGPDGTGLTLFTIGVPDLGDDILSDLTGAGTYGVGLTGTTDAVIVKGATSIYEDINLGTDPIDNVNEVLIYGSSTGPRTLIVGVNNPSARPIEGEWLWLSPASAGKDAKMQSRFLVESGHNVFDSQAAFLCYHDETSDACETPIYFRNSFSFFKESRHAAARVAGFAALVRQKFPALSGAQTAKILLDTATYEGLSCHPNCRLDIYGQGRVDITNALSPIGKLE